MLELSVIVPVYNTEEYLRECLDSIIKALEGINSEVLIIDDGSEDGSRTIADEYCGKHKKFKLLTSNHAGPGAARNMGIDKAKGKYLAFVDSDDFVMPDIYHKMLKVARLNGSDMVTCDIFRKRGNVISQSNLQRIAFLNIEGNELSIKDNPNLIYDCTSCNKLILRKTFKKYYIKYPVGCIYEDGPPLVLLYLFSKKVSLVREPLYCWRIRTGHSKSITQQRESEDAINDRIKMITYLCDILSRNGNQELVHMVLYKALKEDFTVHLNSVINSDEKTAMKLIEPMAAFIEEKVDAEFKNCLSLFDAQKIQYVLDRDFDSLKRLFNYKRINYNNAPVISSNDEYKMILPGHLFKIERDDINHEFDLTPFWGSIDTIDKQNNGLDIHSHVYVRRINIESTDQQDINVYLINDLTGARMPVSSVKEGCPVITAARGTMINYDDYKEYSYNYDGTGFVVNLNFDYLELTDSFIGLNYFIVECNNPVGNRTQPLRFCSATAKKSVSDLTYESEKYIISFYLDELENSVLDVRRKR